jgi:hypothetical protein
MTYAIERIAQRQIYLTKMDDDSFMYDTESMDTLSLNDLPALNWLNEYSEKSKSQIDLVQIKTARKLAADKRNSTMMPDLPSLMKNASIGTLMTIYQNTALNHMSKFDEPDFNIFEFKEAVGADYCLPFIATHIFVKFDFFSLI